jgi:hypothetical protein
MHLQSNLPKLLFQRKLKKKMASNQNGTVLVKFILVIRFLIYLIYTPDHLQTLKFMQFGPWKNFNFSS